MPDATKTHIHVHKSWIAGGEARFLCRYRRWSYGERETERDREGGKEKEKREREWVQVSEREREKEGGWYQLYSGTYQHRHKLFSFTLLLLLPPHQPHGFASHTCSSPLHIHHLKPTSNARKTSFLHSSDLWHLDHCLLQSQGPSGGSARTHLTNQSLQKTEKSGHLTRVWQDFLGPAAGSCF